MTFLMEIILGLDVSTQCIGLTLAASDGVDVNILQVTHFRLKTPSKVKGVESLFYKSSYFEEILKNYGDLSKYNVNFKLTNVVIEEPLIGSNNSETASTLLRFNGMISQSVYHILGVIPEFISSYDARKYAFPELMSIRKYNKKGEVYSVEKIRRSLKKNDLVLFGSYQWDCAKKYILWNKISEMFPDIQWAYDKNGELKKENFDASDSLICVIGYVNKRAAGRVIRPTVVEYVETMRGDDIVFNYRMDFGGTLYDKTIEL